MIFRALDKEFIGQLKDKNNALHYILDFERKNRKSFMVEIRNNFLDLYFLGHTIEVKKRGEKFYLIASNEFNPKELLVNVPKEIMEPYGKGKWCVCFNNIKNYKWFEEILSSAIAQIVRHKKGNISEGVSEVNHFIDNRAIGRNGILVIDRQVVYPRSGKGRIDLLGLKRLSNGKFTFAVIELKNKNNKEIGDVFTRQLKRYIDLIYKKYDDFTETYSEVLKQKVHLGLLRSIDCQFARKSEISKKDIQGIAILDNYNVKSDLRANGLLGRALRDWAKMGKEYAAKLFLKTNVLDDTFFSDRPEAEKFLSRFKACNL